MSEETNEGTWSGLKKTIIGMLSTVVAGGGTGAIVEAMLEG